MTKNFKKSEKIRLPNKKFSVNFISFFEGFQNTNNRAW